MKAENLIEVEDLWKRYWVTQEKRRSLKDTVVSGFKTVRSRQSVWALQGLNFEVKRGRSLGIVGNNGAGKSTLLRLLSGLGRPTRGQVAVRGRAATLLELGTGFHSDLTGRENIYIGGLVAGLTRQEVTDRIDRIIDFAELEAVIDTPLRTYSSGMYLRLAFATAINYDPDLLIVDEALGVGDIRFQNKCLKRLVEMKRAGTTVLLVTHVMEQAQELCDEVLWLENGQARMYGPTVEVIQRYKERAFTRVVAHPGANRTEGDQELAGTRQAEESLVGTREIEICDVRIKNEFGTEVDAITSGDPLHVRVDYLAHQRITRPNFMVGIFREDGLKCYESSTEADGVFLEAVEGAGSISLTYSALPLLRGSYWLGISVFDQNWEKAYDYRGQMAPFQVVGNVPGTGIFHPPHKWNEIG
jgi:lipopolysaccharide transport system ATP-binding protein